jgi:hypothetical protein
MSYVREDARDVDQLQQTLEAAGISVWRDTANLWPGEDWRRKIRDAITNNALVFIACFSSHSAARAKSYQNEELLLAIDQLRQRRPDDPWLIPVRFDDCPVPEFDLGAGRTLASIQRVDLFGEHRDVAMARLVAAVQRLLGQRRPHQDTRERARPKPGPLPGQPSSVQPQLPPAGMLPLTVKGYLAKITLYPDRIQIDRTFIGRMNGNKSTSILWQQVVGVDFLDPTPLINGHIHFASAADPRGLTATGSGNRIAAVARNPHAIMFTWQQRAAYEQLRSLLTTS